jgi:hypothetical protein
MMAVYAPENTLYKTKINNVPLLPKIYFEMYNQLFNSNKTNKISLL